MKADLLGSGFYVGKNSVFANPFRDREQSEELYRLYVTGKLSVLGADPVLGFCRSRMLAHLWYLRVQAFDRGVVLASEEGYEARVLENAVLSDDFIVRGLQSHVFSGDPAGLFSSMSSLCDVSDGSSFGFSRKALSALSYETGVDSLTRGLGNLFETSSIFEFVKDSRRDCQRRGLPLVGMSLVSCRCGRKELLQVVASLCFNMDRTEGDWSSIRSQVAGFRSVSG